MSNLPELSTDEHQSLLRRIEDELLDGYDEELYPLFQLDYQPQRQRQVQLQNE